MRGSFSMTIWYILVWIFVFSFEQNKVKCWHLNKIWTLFLSFKPPIFFPPASSLLFLFFSDSLSRPLIYASVFCCFVRGNVTNIFDLIVLLGHRWHACTHIQARKKIVTPVLFNTPEQAVTEHESYHQSKWWPQIIWMALVPSLYPYVVHL